MPYKSPTMLLALAASGDAAALAAALGSAAPAALAEKSSDGFSLLHVAVGLKSASARGATVRACTLALFCQPPPPLGGGDAFLWSRPPLDAAHGSLAMHRVSG